MGVFQITATIFNKSASERLHDRVSKDKSMRAVVSANFALE